METYHPSNQALQTAMRGERQRGIDHRTAAWREAADILSR